MRQLVDVCREPGECPDSIVFKPEELKEVQKDFRGIIVRAEYGTPWTVEGSPIEAPGKRMRVEFQTEEYESNQYEWYPPSSRIGTKWGFWLTAMKEVGVLKMIADKIVGKDDDERMQSLCKALIGLDCHWEVKILESPFGKRTEPRKIRLTLPVKYHGFVSDIKPRVEAPVPSAEIPTG